VEHLEITRYGSLIAQARELGHTECAQPLKPTLA
jgi:ferritin-like metal-binding protein YciE